MFSMNVDYYDLIFLEIKAYLQESSKYDPIVLKKPMAINPIYPQVVMSEITNAHDNQSLNRRETISILGYEVDIFSTNKVINGITVDNLVICRELSKLSDDIFNHYGFRRLSSTPTPAVDTTLYRIVNRYNGRMFNNFVQIL